MDLDIPLGCDDFLLTNTSSSFHNGDNNPCAKILKGSQTKSPTCGPPPELYMASSTSSSISTDVMSQDCRLAKESLVKAPNISYELALAKSIMQQYSTISGDNLFDHLSEIIKRVIDERPPNVIDFFEEFSRSVREQKFHLPERFPPDGIFEEKRLYKVAKKQLISMKLPYPEDLTLQTSAEDDLEEERIKNDDLKLEKPQALDKFLTFNDRVQHLQFFWNQCGFSINSEDIFQLACSMDRLQTHPSITQCRFWGMVNGLKASYYVVEASLSNEEYESRLLQMEREMQENNGESTLNEKLPSHIGPELTPGAVGWENYPEEELIKMQTQVLPVPLIKTVEVFDIPPEPIGKGVNRYSYFVVNSLSDEWIELPIVTPKQISLSRQMKKFLTGDLETNIVSYPSFCGKEKHYLRAMIARITAGTYIAPKNYYRKMTKKERRLFEGEEYDEAEEEEEEEEEEELLMGEEEGDEEKEVDNDIVLLKNENYNSSISLNKLNNIEKWVHVRPNILLQGRVVWYNEEKAQREREKERKRLEKIRLQEEIGENESELDNDEEEEEGEDEEEELEIKAEKGPAILTSCSRDINNQTSDPWVARFTSKFTNQNERILIMKSNVWPGACTFIYKDLCESIYLGWGHKLVSRNMMWQHMTPTAEEYQHKVEDFIETIDPSVELEEAYQLSLLKKELKFTQIDDYDEHGAIESTEDEEIDDDTD